MRCTIGITSWIQRLFSGVDAFVVIYWIGFYLSLMMPGPQDCHCCALIVPPERVIVAFDAFYSLVVITWFATVWVFVRLIHFFVNIKLQIGSILLYFVFAIQALVQIVFTLMLLATLLVGWGASNPNCTRWQDCLLGLSCLPTAVLVIFLNRKLGRAKRLLKETNEDTPSLE